MDSLQEHFQVNSLKRFGIESFTEGIIARAALYYLSETSTTNWRT